MPSLKLTDNFKLAVETAPLPGSLFSEPWGSAVPGLASYQQGELIAIRREK